MAEFSAQRHHARDPYGTILLILALAALVVGLAMMVAGHKPAPSLRTTLLDVTDAAALVASS